MKNQVSNMIIFMTEIAALNAVYWVLKTPVVFGDSATLTCMVEQKDNCDSEATRRWDGGLNKNILLLNGHSTNASKYYEVVDQPCDNFSMVIMDFGMNDVNCEYRCTFEFETSRRMLTLDARHFIGIKFGSEHDSLILFGILILVIIEAVSCVVICRKTMTEDGRFPLVRQRNERQYIPVGQVDCNDNDSDESSSGFEDVQHLNISESISYPVSQQARDTELTQIAPRCIISKYESLCTSKL